MDFLNGSNGFVGRDVIFRSIQFERYRKPSVVSYPRHAIVLNPQHTRQVARDERAKVNTDEASSSESEDSKRSDIDDDDPLNIEEEQMLCRDEQLRQFLHLRWRHVGPVGCGLENMGNTCFVNSVLQAIAYTPALAQYFAGTFKAPCSHMVGAPYDYAYALGETIRNIHTPSNRACRAALLVSNLKGLFPHFRLGRQGDAHEFAVHLLHACHRSILFRQIGSRKVSSCIEQTSALQRVIGGYLRSVIAWSRQEEIHRLLKAGKFQEAADLKISSRGSSSDVLVSNTYDPFVTLSVEVVGQTLDHCLAKLCQEEKLCGHSYISPRGVGVRATKRFQLHKLPPVLIIHMKRFNCMGGKVTKYIQYPKVLNLAPFCTDKGRKTKAASRCDVDGDETNRSCLYELNAICIHEGNLLVYGHYYSVVRARNGMWLVCNDERVSYCDEERALRQQAYMLFYSRVEPSSLGAKCTQKKETRVSQMLDRRSVGEAATGRMTTSMLPGFVREDAEEEMGRPLSEEEVRRMMRKKAAAEQHSPDEGRKENGLHRGELNGQRETSSAHASSSSSDEADGHPLRISGGVLRGVASSAPVNGKKETSAFQNGHVNSRYRGIVKAIRQRMAPSALVATATTTTTTTTTGAQTTGEMTKVKEAKRETIVGGHVMEVLEEMKQQSVPSTVARPRHAPKFCQRVRDPMWEMEMDRGRVKRVREKREEHVGENKFQRAEIAFDSRGRRHRNV
ncbi:ubiquitin hydrolase, putative [Trypanosoma cruzi marinkellei]|uniref:Ubiquitin carboxyl-terminal hydrolase n=1 Tax=Trypanosoma cruzi marinkellei TaxID=85056 RepID=K2PEL7_TRYCR|nr:ubiquitin hydrolase, putative [Trypanosoma cruzi marinkellei]